MLQYTLILLALVLIAGFFGFSGVTGSAALVAKVLFFLSVAGLAVSLIANFGRRGGIGS